MRKSVQNPQRESAIILAEILKKPLTYLKMYPGKTLSQKVIQDFWRIAKKRKQHFSLAAIFQKKHWAGLTLYVNEAVLIPRDETAYLCEHYLQKVLSNAKNPPKNLLDIGTGSGAIALWAKKHFPPLSVYGCDIDKEALKVANINAAAHQLSITFFQSNLLEKIPCDLSQTLLTANLPYLPYGAPCSPEVRREPFHALFAGSSGLTLYERLAKMLVRKSFHSLWIEFLPHQAQNIKKLFTGYGFHCHLLPYFTGEIFFAVTYPPSQDPFYFEANYLTLFENPSHL